MKADTYYKIYSHVQLVKGVENSILYDFQKSRVVFINDGLKALIELFNHKSIRRLEAEFESQKSLFNENIRYLEEKEVLFKTDYPHGFVNVNMEYEVPEHITNAVLDYNGSYDLDLVFSQLDHFLVKYVELRLHKMSPLEYQEVFRSLNKFLNRGVKALQLVVDYDDKKCVDELLVTDEYPKIIRIIYYNAKNSIALLEDSIEFCYTRDNLKDIRNTNNDYVSNFIFTSEYFIEAQNYNPYYYKRVCIDHDGTIKNCLKNVNSFGNIKDGELQRTISSEEFQKLWYAKHDLIEDIKDHELRYNMFITHDLKPTGNGLFRIICS